MKHDPAIHTLTILQLKTKPFYCSLVGICKKPPLINTHTHTHRETQTDWLQDEMSDKASVEQ